MTTKEAEMDEQHEVWDPPLSLSQISELPEFGELLHRSRLSAEPRFTAKLRSRFEDAFQDACYKLFVNPPKNQPTFSAWPLLNSYIYKTTLSSALQALRREPDTSELPVELFIEKSSSELSSAEFADIRGELDKLLAEMAQIVATCKGKRRKGFATLLCRAYLRLEETPSQLAEWQQIVSKNPATQRTDVRRSDAKQEVYRWLDEGKFAAELKPTLKYLFEGKLK